MRPPVINGRNIVSDQTERKPLQHRLVHELFEDRVRDQPDAIAVTCGDLSLTYRELEDRANALASALRSSYEIGPDTLVSLMLDRSEHVLISMLGVLKAGGAYVPLAPDMPFRRIELILRESQSVVVLTEDRYYTRLSRIVDFAKLAVDIIPVGKVTSSRSAPSASEPVAVVRPDQGSLAYVIYTSGTSGRPKGVMVEHQSVVNYICNVGDRLSLSADDTCGFSTNVSFDLTVTTTLACLALGGRVAVYRDNPRDENAYRDFLVEHGVTMIKVTPSYFGLIAGSLHETGVRTVVLGGEKLSRAVLERMRTCSSSKITVYDEYGPTEATVGTCAGVVHPLPEGVTPNIGRLYANYHAYVVDDDLQPVQDGEVGELCIGGLGLARGYLQQPRLTAERFLANPFTIKVNDGGLGSDCVSRIYRTGDLVRWLPGGELEYVGRNDDQVKIRGFRVELGEVEHAIESYGDVDRAVVVAGTASFENQARSLIAYVVAGEFGCSEEALSEFLREILPEYMLPSAFVFLEELPLTSNGKVNRVALPMPDQGRAQEHLPPRTELERDVAEIWAELLGQDIASIGITNDFFSLGGDSIIAIQVLGQLRQRLGVHFPVQELLNRPTIDRICQFLEGPFSEQPLSHTDVGRQESSALGEAPLLPIQEWFFRSDFAHPHHWNQAFLIATPRLDVQRLRKCVFELGNRHGAFRTRFRRNPAGEFVQYGDNNSQPTDLVVGSCADINDIQAQLTAWQADFDLEHGPVYRIGYFDGLADGSARVFVACHHLIVDAVSWRIIAEDLETLYLGRKLQSTGSSYRQWTTVFPQYLSLHPEEGAYWEDVWTRPQKTGAASLHLLMEVEASRSTSQLTLDRNTTECLPRCNQAYGTQIIEVLLAAFAHALAELTGEAVNDIILEGHGREEFVPSLDVGRTVGWFTTMFPVRLQMGADRLATLRETKETLRGIPAKGIGYGALYGYHDELPGINFNYLGRLDGGTSSADGVGWRLTREPAGEAVHPANLDKNIMTVNGWIVDGRLTFSIASNFGQASADRFAQLYEKSLVELIGELSAATRTYLTPSDIDYVVSAECLDQIQSEREIEDVYPANSLQQGFIYQAITQGQDDDAYIVQMLWDYAIRIDSGALREAWIRVQRELPALRLRFCWREELIQIIDVDAKVDWRYVDLSRESADESAESIRRLREADRSEPYNLATGPLFRIYLIERDPNSFSCLFSHHHSILDGWSITVLLSRVHVLYEALFAGLPAETSRDRSYLAGQKYLHDHRKDHTSFWRDYLSRFDERMDLQGLLREEARAFGLRVELTRKVKVMQEESFTISGEQFARMREFAQNSAVTLSALLQYVWHKTLSVYTSATQTISGVVISGRGIPVADIQTSVGLFINTLPLIVDHGAWDDSVLEGIREVQLGINELNAYSTVNLSELNEGADRLFDTLFIYENWPKINPNGWQTRLAARMGEEFEKLDYPLSAIVSESPSSIHYRLVYAAELFDARSMADMLDVQRHLLDEILDDAERPWREVAILSNAQQREIIGTLNGQAERLPPPRTLVEAFEEQVRRHPERIAVTFEGSTLSYRSLDERANRLAHWLIEVNRVQPQELVVLCLDKGVELLWSILAVLKAGAAYVLTDPNYPDSRFSYILEDTATRLVITTCRYVDRLFALSDSGRACVILALDSPQVREALTGASSTVPTTYVSVDGLMYVLYTSGTTGVPKGVMIEHGSYGQTIAGVKARYFAELDAVSTHSLTNHVFDIFGLEYGLPLWTGGCVGLESEMPASLDCSALDFLQMTPSVCDLMLDRLVNVPDDFLLLVGGEKLPEKLLDSVLAKSIDLVNVYGPTETTIWSTSEFYRFKYRHQRHPVGLGKPFAGEDVYVLDGALRSLPMGAVGELCIGGSGLARGYLNKNDLSTERFVTPPGDLTDWRSMRRLYRTGDLVRLLPSGVLEFVGRNDSQVKIDGHRIEVGEVESALAGHPSVRQSVVVPLQSSSTVLVGYYVADHEVPEAELSDYLRRSLPAYMVPSRYVHLDKIPLNINGKLDHAALPRPDIAGARVHIAPRSRVEEQLCVMMARVLDHDPLDVGIDDDFFLLGGTSLLSIKLVSAVERELGISTTVGYLLAHRTIREFVKNLDKSRIERVTIPTATFARPEDQLLSFAQERLWFIERFAGGITAYNLPLVLEVAEHVDTDTLLKAVRGVITRHEVLRTLVKETPAGIGYQVVLDEQALAKIEVLQVADQLTMYAEIRRDLQRVFDLGSEAPVRVRLYEVPDIGRRLVFVIHHIAFDGWSMDVLLEDLHTAYELIEHAAPGGNPLACMPAQQLRYRDFAVWQRDYLTGERLERLRRFWQEKLQDYQALNMVLDRPRPDSPDYRGADIRLDVGAEVSQQLRRLAEELQVSLFSLLLSAYFLTLRCFTNQDDIVVGSPIANRDHPQLAPLIGFFVNTLPLRSRIDGQARITDYVRHTAREVLEVLRHQELPLEQVLEILDVERSLSRHPIFQVTFGVHGFGTPMRSTDASSRTVLRTLPETKSLYTSARFDLSTFIDDSGESLEVEINYATSLFEYATVESLAETYITILRQFAELAASETRKTRTNISDLVYVDGPRYWELVEDWSAPRKQYESEMLLHRSFEEQAFRSPQRVALVWKAHRYTYLELSTEANRLAHHLLRASKVAPNAIVMLCMDRSAELVVSILATLKAGGCYLPADPTFSDDRIAFILFDAGVRTILTHGRYVGRFAEILATAANDDRRLDLGDIKIIAVDDPTVRELVDAMPETDPITEVAAGDLAYVLYTSGTTGKPKGVPQPHANVARLFSALEGIYLIREDDVWTLFHNLVFDFTVWEIWGAFLYGGTLVVPTFEETRDPELYYALCRRERVTMLCQTPTAFYQFVNVALAKDDTNRLDELRYVFFGGEPLNVTLLNEWFARYSYDRPLLAMGYGTTETTVFTCYKIYNETDEGSTDIGSLIPDVAGYVLDGQERLLPIGAVGQLHIGGAGLAPGYLNLPELTASKFIPNPFVSDSKASGRGPSDHWRNSRLYKSGDLVRWAPDRSLRFVGRNDLQVKIRGHRIELGEIEAVISGVPGVTQCAVVVRKSGVGERQLVGYYVSEYDVDSEAVFEQLRSTLPTYMVPAALVPMQALPRKISGKLDVGALPEPQFGMTREIVPPRDDQEARACRVLAKVLDADPQAIGIHDDFFDLGGNSILSIMLASTLSRELGRDISVADIFRHRTVACLVGSPGSGCTPTPAIPRLSEHPYTPQVLSFQQEWLWFVDRNEGGTASYNIHLCYDVAPGVSLYVLEGCFRAVYERHEALRTVIRERPDGELHQVVLHQDDAPLTLGHASVSGIDELATRVSQDASRQFDLASEPPFRITFYQEVAQGGSKGRVYVGVFAHHIAFDGWSADLMLHELELLYAELSQRRAGSVFPPTLPELTIQYRDYAAWQRERLAGGRLEELLEYWTARLAGVRPLELPLDRARPLRMDHRGERLVFEIDADTSVALRRLAADVGVGLFSVLLSAYYLMIRSFTGRSDLIVGVPVANRSHGQTHDLIGCFINTLTLDFEVDGDDEVSTLIEKVGARVAEAQEYGELPFARLVAELKLPIDHSRHPLVQLWFDLHSFTHTGTGRVTHGGRSGDRRAGAALLQHHPLNGRPTDGGSGATTKGLDLGLVVVEGETLVGTLTYAVSLFDRSTVERFAYVLQTILKQFAML